MCYLLKTYNAWIYYGPKFYNLNLVLEKFKGKYKEKKLEKKKRKKLKNKFKVNKLFLYIISNLFNLF